MRCVIYVLLPAAPIVLAMSLTVVSACGGSTGGSTGGDTVAMDGRDSFPADDHGAMLDVDADDTSGIAGSDGQPEDGVVGCPGDGPSGSFTEQDLIRSSVLNTTQVDVLFLSPMGEGALDDLTFKVVMTNHTCSVPGYEHDLVGKVTFENSDGLALDSGYGYEALALDGHHPVGILTIPWSAGGGQPLIGCDTAGIGLVFDGIDGEERTFEWDEPYLAGLRRP